MALVVEDGSIVANADSYVTRSDFIAWSLRRGYTVADDDLADNKLVVAFDFINGIESSLAGLLSVREQTGAYPRTDLVLQTYSWLSTEIPTQAKDYQMSLALDQVNGIDIFNPPQSDSVAVRRSRVEGAVEEEYAVSDSSAFVYQSLSNRLRQILQRSRAGYGIIITMG